MFRRSVSGLALRCGIAAAAIVLSAVPLQAQWWIFGRSTRSTLGQFSSDYPYGKSLAPYISTPMPAVDQMLDLAKLKPSETLYDLGCGDGRIVVEAAARYHAKAVGIEISRRLARQATDNVKSRSLQSQVQIIHGDMMQVDLAPADVVTLYLSTLANERLRPNLEQELRQNARVVSYDFPIAGWRPTQLAETEAGKSGIRHTIYVYQLPASVKP
jgi:protein-L-isoaspartate O-methyltransferase